MDMSERLFLGLGGDARHIAEHFIFRVFLKGTVFLQLGDGEVKHRILLGLRLVRREVNLDAIVPLGQCRVMRCVECSHC